ncbi:hypothetical protein LCGC14_2556670, partial [marine sediment metagenome]
MLEACVNRMTGEILCTKPSGYPWSPNELDGPVLCVLQIDERVLAFEGVDFGGITSYPTRTMLRERYVAGRKQELGVDVLPEAEAERVADYQWPMLFRVSDREIRPNAKITSEHQLSAHIAVPVFDMRMMVTATSSRIMDVDSDGGADYTSLVLWWATEKLETLIAAHARCSDGSLT